MHHGLVRHLFTSRSLGRVLAEHLRKVKVRLVEQVVNLLRLEATLFQTGKHPFVLFQFFHRISREKGVKLMRPLSQHFFEVLHHLFNRLLKSFRTPRLPCIHVPLILHLVKPLEVDWPPAHGTPSAGAFEIPALYAPRAEIVAAAQLAARTSLVAYRALHFFNCDGF